MSDLTRGRKEPCDNNLGGVKEIWLAPWVKYSPMVMYNYRNGVITSFPTTLMYQYEGKEKSFSENIRSDKGYDQEINLRFTGQELVTSNLVSIILKNRLRAIVIDNKGKIRVAGLQSGLTVDVEAQSGGAKADFIGYQITLKGIEELSAPYLQSFPGAGFEKEGVTFGCFLASSSLVASTSDLISSCNTVQNPGGQPIEDCFRASSGLKASTDTIISKCNA